MKNKRFPRLPVLALALFLLVAVPRTAAYSADPTSGAACSANGSVTRAGGTQESGVGALMVCESGTWKTILGFNGTGQVTQIGNQSCAAGDLIQFSSVSTWLCTGTAGIGDNLGNHIAGQNIQLGSYWLSGDGDDEGLKINSAGAATFSGNITMTSGGQLYTNDTAGSLLIYSGDGSTTGAGMQLYGITHANAGRMYLNFGGADATGFVRVRHRTNSAWVNILEIEPTGEVGINTTNPSAALHVVGTGKFTGEVDMGSQKITSLATPTVGTDAANKAYIDGLLTGVDADTLDTLDSLQFLRSDADDSGTNLTLQSLTVTDGKGFMWENGVNSITHNDGGGNVQIRFGNENTSGDVFTHAGGAAEITSNIDAGSNTQLTLRVSSNPGAGTGAAVTWGSDFTIDATGAAIGGNAVWHAGNDGAGSGLDADTLDGNTSADFVAITGDTMTGNLWFNGGVRYIGTTDDNNFRIRTNNANRLQIDNVGDFNFYGGAVDGVGNITSTGTVDAVILKTDDFVTGGWCTANNSGRIKCEETGLNQSDADDRYVNQGGDTMTGNLWFTGTTRHIGTSDNNDFRIRTNGTNRISIRAGGNIGIADTTPSYELDINGTARASVYLYRSDRRLKDDIKSISGGLDLVDKLRGVTFRWKDTGRPSAGMIAQEVEEVLPAAVFTDDEGIKSIDYNQLIGPMVEAIKELKADNDQLKADNENLHAEIEALQKAVGVRE